MRLRRSGALLLCFATALVLATVQAGEDPFRSVFNPNDYATLNGGTALTPSTSLDIFTSTAALPTPTISIDGGTAINGVRATNESGNVVMALFCFSSINIPSEVTITVTGDCGVVLASQGTLSFGATINLSGSNGSSAAAGQGGPGAEGGARRSTLVSNPPGSNAGDGGYGSSSARGYGGGGHGSRSLGRIGGGGGYGGAGSDAGTYATWYTTPRAGLVYGDDLLTDLYGGSGGGLYSSYNNPTMAGGGGGGGSVELVAMESLAFAGTISSNGGTGVGNGGGGSGGGVLLASPKLDVDGGTINARGGVGGGGGGRVAFYSCVQTGTATVSVARDPGALGTAENGTFRYHGDGGAGDLAWPHEKTLYYVGDGGASTWNNATAWSLDSGGTGGVAVPGTDDVVILDGNSPNCTVDIAVSVSELHVGATSGHLDLAGFDLTAADVFDNLGTVRLHGDETVSSGVMGAGSTVEYYGNGDYSGSDLVLGSSYHHLQFNNTSGSWAHTSTLDVGGDLTISAGILTSGGNVSVDGDWSNSGSYTHGGYTVTLGGVGQTVLGSTTFSGFTKTVSLADTLTFQAGETQTVLGTLNLQGAASNLLALRSTTPGVQWSILPSGTRTVQYVDVQDSNNLQLPVINPALSVSSGNNLQWWDDLVPGASATPTAIMLNDQVTLSCAPAGGAGGPFTFSWVGPNGFTSTLQNPGIVVPPLLGDNIYTVTVTDAAGNTSTQNVIVNTTVDELLGRPVASPTAVVLGNSVSLSCDPVGGSGTYGPFEWTGPGGFTSNLKDPGLVAPPLVGENVYTLRVWDSVGLSSVSSVSVTVVAEALAANPAVDPVAIAVNESVSLSCAPTGGSGVYTSFLWTGPDGFTSNQQNPVAIKISTPGFKTYTVTVTDSLGFVDTASVSVPVLESALTVNASAYPTIVYQGESTSLSCAPTGATGVYTAFQWTGPGGFTSSLQNPGAVVPPLPGANTYTVTVTDASGLTVSESVTVLVGLAASQVYVKPGWIRYRASTASSQDRPLDLVKITMQGVDLKPGDRIMLAFNNRAVGDLARADGLTLDQRYRARGQLGSSPYLFSNVKIRYVPKRRMLRFRASRGVMYSGTSPMVMSTSGMSESVPVAILVDHAPHDGLPDLAAFTRVRFKVKVRASSSGVVVESGSKARGQ